MIQLELSFLLLCLVAVGSAFVIDPDLLTDGKFSFRVLVETITLKTIAEINYGNGDLWPLILAGNRHLVALPATASSTIKKGEQVFVPSLYSCVELFNNDCIEDAQRAATQEEQEANNDLDTQGIWVRYEPPVYPMLYDRITVNPPGNRSFTLELHNEGLWTLGYPKIFNKNGRTIGGFGSLQSGVKASFLADNTASRGGTSGLIQIPILDSEVHLNIFWMVPADTTLPNLIGVSLIEETSWNAEEIYDNMFQGSQGKTNKSSDGWESVSFYNGDTKPSLKVDFFLSDGEEAKGKVNIYDGRQAREARIPEGDYRIVAALEKAMELSATDEPVFYNKFTRGCDDCQKWKIYPVPQSGNSSYAYAFINEASSQAICSLLVSGSLKTFVTSSYLDTAGVFDIKCLWYLAYSSSKQQYQITAADNNIAWEAAEGAEDGKSLNLVSKNGTNNNQYFKIEPYKPEYPFSLGNGVYTIAEAKFILKRALLPGSNSQYAFLLVNTTHGHALTAADSETLIMNQPLLSIYTDYRSQLWQIVKNLEKAEYSIESVGLPGSFLVVEGSTFMLKKTLVPSQLPIVKVAELRTLPNDNEKVVVRRSDAPGVVMDIWPHADAKMESWNAGHQQKPEFAYRWCPVFQKAAYWIHVWHWDPYYNINIDWGIALASNFDVIIEQENNQSQTWTHKQWVVEPDYQFHGLYYTFRNCWQACYLQNPDMTTNGLAFEGNYWKNSYRTAYFIEYGIA